MEKENLDNGIKPDVNESLALAGLFRKVSVKERLPQEKGIYIVYVNDNANIQMPFVCIFSKEQFKWMSGDYKFDENISYWLEEIELPTDENIWAGAMMNCKHSGVEGTDSGIAFDNYVLGAKRVRDFVLAGKAVTAKDNVR